MIRSAPTLTMVIRFLPDMRRERLSSLTYDLADGEWRLSYHLYGHETTGLNENGEETPLTKMGLAPIQMTRISRVPDDRARTDEHDPVAALRRLHLSGIVGNLDVAWIGDRLHAKTRAGSDAERWEWLTGRPYPERPPRRRVRPEETVPSPRRTWVSLGKEFPHSANAELREIGAVFRGGAWRVREEDAERASEVVARHTQRYADRRASFGRYNGSAPASPSDLGKRRISIGSDVPESAHEYLLSMGAVFDREQWKVRRRDYWAAREIVLRHGGTIRAEAVEIMEGVDGD